MTAFLIAASLLTLVVLTLLLFPLWRARQSAAAPLSATESPALRILREQGAALDAELAAGQIDEKAHREALEELARRAVAEAAEPEAPRSYAPRRGWAIATGVAVPLLAVLLYLQLGNPTALDPTQSNAPHAINAGEFNAMVEKLAAKVAANPDDLEALHMLGRSYMVLQRFKEASEAFALLASKQPQDAQVYADWADALGSATDGKLAGEPEKLIAKALKLDPNNVKALALAGTVAFDKSDFKQAVTLWEKMAALVDPQSEMGQSAQSMIAEARGRAGMPVPAATMPPAHPAVTAPQTPAAPAAASALSARGRISLASKFKGAFDPAATLFVFARPAAGGPPLAALRFKASDLPLDFDFSQANLMMGGGTLLEKITIGARISKSGQPTPGPGDLQGLSAPLAPDAQGVQLEISEEIGK